jgi:hypothetical protein
MSHSPSRSARLKKGISNRLERVSSFIRDSPLTENWLELFLSTPGEGFRSPLRRRTRGS